MCIRDSAYIDEEHRKSSFDYLESNGFLFCYQADDGVVLNQRSCDEMCIRDRDMVALQTEAVQEVVGVFDDMNQCMQKLFDALKEIVSSRCV